MIDFSSWKEKQLKVTSLMLDPRNPRIPDLGHSPSEAEVIAGLIEHEGLYELTKSIVDRGGLFPSELLVAVEEDGEKIIIEGNRRLGALKLLVNPDIAPEKERKSFRVLKDRIPPQNVQEVKVTFAPSREAAAPLIVERHTGDALKRWLPAQQAKFIRTLVGPGNTIDDVASQIGMSRGDIVKNLRLDTMIQVAHVMPLPDDVRTKLQDPRQFPISALERLIQSKEGVKFLGVEFDADANVVGHVQEEEFKRGYTRMISDIARGTVDTRKLNTTKEIEAYLSTFGQDTPNKQKKGVFTSSSLLSGKTPASAAAKQKAAPKPQPSAAGRDSIYLIPRGFRLRVENERIKNIVVELRSMKVADYANSLGVMLRILLELVVGHYLDVTGKIEPLLEAARKKGKGNDWYPTLSQTLAAVMQDPDIKLPVMLKRALNRMLSDENSLLSIEHLNQFVHNRYEVPKERDLRTLWNVLQPLLEQLAVATSKPSTPPANPKK